MSSSEGIPEEWKELRHKAETAPDVPAAAPLVSLQFVAATLSAETISNLKEECKRMWEEVEGSSGDFHLSINDVISATLIGSMGIECEQSPLSMIMEYRGLGIVTIF